ncbi:MAG: alkaline phosphatase family protein [Bacteroidota bacterium]|jgi:predicted AlkP superfamily pyrophosphatase or phosphodiesterase
MSKCTYTFLIILGALFPRGAAGQPPDGQSHRPQLIVEIVLDQVPYDYLARFEPYFCDSGFTYLLRRGADFTNAQYGYAYTKTAPGHAAIATGTYSHVNGIVGNRWYDRVRKKAYDSVDDDSVSMVGKNGKGCSPRWLMVPSFGDMLRKTTNFRSKVIGISNKDRSAIMLAGKSGTAYWIEDSTVVTSTYYMASLPSWVREFNESGIFRRNFGNWWRELQPEVAASICDVDDAPYEADVPGFGKAFPHHIVGNDSLHLTSSYLEALDTSPFSTEILLQFARRAFVRESLGVRGVTDMLCISISATDIVGHAFGPNSHEVFDNMLRTDRMIAEFLAFLKQKIGLDNCVIAVSADHGIAPIPEYKMKESPDVRTARISTKEITARATRALDHAFGQSSSSWVTQTIDGQIYLNENTAKEKGLSLQNIRGVLKDSLTDSFPIDKAYTADELSKEHDDGCFCERVKRSFYPSRSGDILILVKPFCIIDSSPTGTNHGMPYTYDTHVLLILAGKGVRQGVYNDAVSPIDIAPTLAAILGIEPPPQCEGNVLGEAITITK